MYELKTNQYSILHPIFSEEIMKYPTARSVVEGKLSGKVFINDFNNLTTAVVLSKINWIFMFGDVENKVFNEELSDYVFNVLSTENDYFVWDGISEQWQEKLTYLYGDKIKSFPRIPFKFNIHKYLLIKRNCKPIPQGFEIKRIGSSLIEKVCQSFHGILMFWDTYDNFLSKGVGFCALHEGEVVCVCQSAFTVHNMSCIDIFTSDKFRMLGLATHTCSAFIEYCIDNNIIPYWETAVINKPSYSLAKKLGFDETKEYPSYIWHKDFT